MKKILVFLSLFGVMAVATSCSNEQKYMKTSDFHDYVVLQDSIKKVEKQVAEKTEVLEKLMAEKKRLDKLFK